MHNHSLYLFEEILPNMTSLIRELETPRQRSIFTINKTEVQLTLTDHHIVLSEALNFRQPTHHCLLAFDTKFEVIYLNPVFLLTRRPNNPSGYLPQSRLKGRAAQNS